MQFDPTTLLDTNTACDGLFGLTDLERDVLLGLCLEADGAFLPVTSDGRLARDAFGRDLELVVVGRNAKGVRVQAATSPLLDANGAPTAAVYINLVYMGLARDTLGRCAWTPTSSGKAVAEGF
jgi:hypothetical protein